MLNAAAEAAGFALLVIAAATVSAGLALLVAGAGLVLWANRPGSSRPRR